MWSSQPPMEVACHQPAVLQAEERETVKIPSPTPISHSHIPISHSHITLPLSPGRSPVSSPPPIAAAMDKSNVPPLSNSAASSALKSLNKSSYKISKQPSSSSSMKAPSPPPPPLPSRLSPSLPPPLPQTAAPALPDHPPPQPPVYNIDKSNFRDVVQKLTGSPSHLLPPQPPAPAAAAVVAPHPARPIMAPPPPPPLLSAIPSRLHRIRPPPLAPLRPPPPILPPAALTLSPLPALPSVCMTAESPISAYMRRLRGMPSPIHVPTSPLGFGCLPSPRTPTSPGVAMPATSPRVRDP